MIEITQKYLKEALIYNPKTGDFFWNPERPESHFLNSGRRNNILSRTKGKKAGCPDAHGYIQINLLRMPRKAHRLAWLYVYGNEPDGIIDHINGNRQDNRIENLRVVSDLESVRNCCIPKNNTSGQIGVSWHKQIKKWRASISDNRKQISLGVYNNKNDAIVARCWAEMLIGFHPNHGRKNGSY